MSKAAVSLQKISAQNVDMLRDAAVESVAQAHAVFEKSSSAAKQMAALLEASSTIFAKGMGEFRAKAFEAFKANSNLTLELLGALATAKNVSEAYDLHSKHSVKQIEALKAQGDALASIAGKVAKESAQPKKS